MLRGFKIQVEGDDLLILTFDRSMSGDMFDDILMEIPNKLSRKITKLLVDRRGQAVVAALAAGVEFGRKLGGLLLKRHVKVALLSNKSQAADDIIAAQIYNAGVPSAQFDLEKKAKLWLCGMLV